MEKKELSWGRVFILIGALMAFLIGSGFASGQETVQYFTGYGVVGGFLVGTFNFVMIYIAYVAYAYAGRTRNLRNLNEVASFYAGPLVGKACETMAWLFTFCCYFFMCHHHEPAVGSADAHRPCNLYGARSACHHPRPY